MFFFLYQHLQKDKTIIQFKRQTKRINQKCKIETNVHPTFSIVKKLEKNPK